jgi:tRNA pseudouridine32 synthase/23S rRNA pseudouridine746 synthase
LPVLGDPAYGENNKDARGLQLLAVALEFTCPLTGRAHHYRAEPR